MKFFHIPTLIILGGSIFCISEKHFERADAIQIYWTSTSLLLVLIVCVHSIKIRVSFHRKKSPDKVRKCLSVIAE